MEKLPIIPNLIIIGGSSRNVGKTSLALRLIEKYADNATITGLKVTSMRPGEESYHGSHNVPTPEDYSIVEETNIESNKDTARMLKAGAKKVYYIETPDSLLKQALNSLMTMHQNGNPIVCESRSLRSAVIPGLFILLKHYDPNQIKPGFNYYENMADLTFTIGQNTRNSTDLANKIQWNGKKWLLNP
ncbi:MAG: hypothetical protein HGA37_04305 [Lentimicrobium sp.]|nr:hypothetical protein [Lentimicrobium sp.]